MKAGSHILRKPDPECMCLLCLLFTTRLSRTIHPRWRGNGGGPCKIGVRGDKWRINGVRMPILPIHSNSPKSTPVDHINHINPPSSTLIHAEAPECATIY